MTGSPGGPGARICETSVRRLGFFLQWADVSFSITPEIIDEYIKAVTVHMTQEKIDRFGKLNGDWNILHYDHDYCKATLRDK